MKKYLLILFVLLLSGSLPVYAEGGYYDKTINGSINGGIGYGAAVYGITREDENPADLGGGYGSNISFNGILNISFFGAELSFNRQAINDAGYTMTDSSENEYTVETEGSGNYLTIDLKGGFYLGTEPADMGYFFLYVGFRKWSGEYDADSVTVNGIASVDTEYLIDSKTEGSGFIMGFRDYSTFAIPGTSVSIVTRAGLWFTVAPGDSITINNDSRNFSSSDGIGIGYEIGLGLAFERMGLSFDLAQRFDIAITVGDLEGGGAAGAIYGSGAYILSCTYVF